jgi:hypothetical protein
MPGRTDAIKATGARLWFLPPYSPDLNPIEQAFAKVKHWMRHAQKRTIDDTWRHIGSLVATIEPAECTNYFANRLRFRQNLNALRKAIARAYRWQHMLEEGGMFLPARSRSGQGHQPDLRFAPAAAHAAGTGDCRSGPGRTQARNGHSGTAVPAIA